MQFGYTILYVPDVPASLAFYQAAFGLNPRFLHDSGDFAELDTGATALAFCSHALLHAMGKSPRAPQADHPSFEIALVTDDVPAAVAALPEVSARLPAINQALDTRLNDTYTKYGKLPVIGLSMGYRF